MDLSIPRRAARALFFCAAWLCAAEAAGAAEAGRDVEEAFARAHDGAPLRYVAIGGSITQASGPGWVGDWLRERFPRSEVTVVNSGMSGTGSSLGIFRIERDVLAHQPDLVAIEYCVNDGGLSDAEAIRYLETMVVRLKASPHPPAIVILEAAARNGREPFAAPAGGASLRAARSGLSGGGGRAARGGGAALVDLVWRRRASEPRGTRVLRGDLSAGSGAVGGKSERAEEGRTRGAGGDASAAEREAPAAGCADGSAARPRDPCGRVAGRDGAGGLVGTILSRRARGGASGGGVASAVQGDGGRDLLRARREPRGILGQRGREDAAVGEREGAGRVQLGAGGDGAGGGRACVERGFAAAGRGGKRERAGEPGAGEAGLFAGGRRERGGPGASGGGGLRRGDVARLAF